MLTLHVFNTELNYIGRIKNWISLDWDEEYQGKGALNLVVDDTEQYARMLAHGNLLYRADRKTAMIAVKVERSGENGTITVCGYTTLHMLEYRMVYNKYVVTKVETGIYNAVRNNLRGLPITLADAKGYDDTVDETVFDCPMLSDMVFDLLKECDLGARMLFDPKTKMHLFEVYKGNDLAYTEENGGHVFSSEFGNLLSLKVTEDDDVFKNVAVICGANPGCDKTTFTYEMAPGLTGIARRELLVDGEPQGTTGETDANGNEVKRSFEDWKKAMLDKGKQELIEHNKVQTFEAVPYPGSYGVRYTLGDLVTCKSSRYDLRFDARITQVKEHHDRKGSEMTLTMGEPVLTYIRGELIKHG